MNCFSGLKLNNNAIKRSSERITVEGSPLSPQSVDSNRHKRIDLNPTPYKSLNTTSTSNNNNELVKTDDNESNDKLLVIYSSSDGHDSNINIIFKLVKL